MRHFRHLLLIALCVLGASALQAAQPEEKRGVWIERADGRFLNLLVEKNNFELYFFDREKNQIEPDAFQAAIHFTPRNVSTRETVLLVGAQDPEKGVYLTSPRFIRPPFTFHANLVLLDRAGNVIETPPVGTFHQPATQTGNGSVRPVTQP